MHLSEFRNQLSLRVAWKKILPFLLIGTILILTTLYISTRAPHDFPTSTRIEIPYGTSLLESAHILSENSVIRSPLLLQILLISRFESGGIKAGTYIFTEPLTLTKVARAITTGTHHVPLVHITIPEGFTNADIARTLHEKLPHITEEEFLHLAQDKEGYLFPETYHVSERITAEDIIELMEDTSNDALDTLEGDLARSGHTIEEIVTMASILEREANSKETMDLVAGILWRRLDEGIPLQVDASFSYLFGKSSEEVTQEDLEYDSPYNTYLYRGLPPTPISNPGLTALRAALHPVESPYLFYLTAPDGTFHYARTFDEHVENKRLYLY